MTVLNTRAYLCNFLLGVFVCTLLNIKPATAQNDKWPPPEYVFYTYPENSPVPHPMHAVQDAQGFLWFATWNGVFRFDGYSATGFYKIPDDTNSFPDYHVECLYIDRDGLIWMGMKNALVVMNPKTLLFESFRHNENNSTSIPEITITSIIEDNNGRVWIGGHGPGTNLGIFNLKSKIFETYKGIQSLVKQFGNDVFPANEIYKRSNGNLLIVSSSKVWELNPLSNDFKIFNFYENNHLEKGVEIGCSLLVDDQILWLAAGDKLYNYQIDNSLLSKSFSCSQLKNSNIWNIIYKSKNQLWVGSNAGVGIFNCLSKEFYFYKHQPGNESSISSTRNSKLLFVDRSGNGWFESGEDLCKANLFKYDFANFKFLKTKYYYGDDDHISYNQILKDTATNKLYISTCYGDGLYIVESKTHSYQSILPPVKSDTNKWNLVNSFSFDRSGTLWAASFHQLFYLDKKNERFISYDLSSINEINNNGFGFISMLFDNVGFMWLGTFHHGIFRIDLKNHQVQNFTSENVLKNKLVTTDQTIVRLQDSRNRIWIYTYGHGAAYYDPSKKAFTCFHHLTNDLKSLNSDDCRAIVKDRNNNIWIVTHDGGLNKYNETTNNFEFYFEKPGVSSKEINDAAADSKGNLWIAYNSSLTQFNTQTQEFVDYDVSKGFSKKRDFSIYIAPDDELFLLYEHNFSSVAISDLKPNKFVPQIAITSFKVFDNELKLKSNVNSLDTVFLEYDENSFAFEFAALDYSNPSRNQFEYTLEGFDKSWVRCGNRHFGNYTNIRPGTYTLKIKGSNSDGFWSPKIKTLTINISCPWWQTWWFRILMAAAVAGAVGSVIRLYIKRKLYMQSVEFEKQQRVLQERTRIASELHDDLGSGLTKISMMSEMAGSIGGDKQQSTLKKISHESSVMVDKMNGIIWALNTKNDSLPNLISFIRKHAFEMFEESQIKIVWESPDEFPEIVITGEVRRNIYLVVKEALHNVLKYSHAEFVKVNVCLKERMLAIDVEDNGCGFKTSPFQRRGELGGNGLLNMKKRMEEVSGTFEVSSDLNKGTKVSMQVSLKNYTKV